MSLLRWAFLACVWLTTWVGAVLLGGLLGGTKWALGWGLMVYPWLALSVGAYCLAWRAARREEADGTLFLRHCLACGRTVPEGAVLCPDQVCDGVEFGCQWDVHRRDAAYRAREQATVAEDLNRDLARRVEQSGWIGNLTWWNWSLMAWYMRGVFGRAGYATETEQLLWWSSRMLAIGGVFWALVVNATVGPVEPSAGGALETLMGWGRILMVLVGTLVLSAYIAVNGPGSQQARLRAEKRMKGTAAAPFGAAGPTRAARQ